MKANINKLKDSIKTVDAIGLILPDGWFGRPYDNFFEVTSINTNNNTININFEKGKLKLNIISPNDIEINSDEILINEFKSCKFEWQEYGDDKTHENEYNKGTISFIARPLTNFKLN
jgi:hypothetical protein